MDRRPHGLLPRMEAIGSVAWASGAEVSGTFAQRVREIHDAHHASIFRVLQRLSGDPDLAADMTQEAFMRLVRRRTLPEQPDRWLVTVALNLFRNERSKDRRRERIRSGHIPELMPQPAPSPIERLESSGRRAAVRRALERLPIRDRELLLLRAEGYSYRDLAAVLELNEASVGTLLSRAKKAFESAYQETDHAS